MTSNRTDTFDPTDPVGAWRSMRDANLDAWAKGMATMVNTESFSKALGIQLDTMLAASAPMQKMVSQYMETYLAQASMPSRAEVVSLAQRMTNIEMRLDDMDARLDDILFAVRALVPAAPALPVAAPPASDAAPAASAAPESAPETEDKSARRPRSR
ncbi:MAG: hypothetical protein WCJ55_00510 [Chloroflexales bacterium]